MVLNDGAATEAGVTLAPRTKKQIQTELARHKICDAVVDCLDQFGYAETTINRVQERAGVSRGALTHHFPSKEEMMVATMEHLLAPVRNPIGANKRPDKRMDKAGAVERDLLRLWTRMVNTKEGRALVEILVASRTDTGLYGRIAPSLSKYDSDFNQEVVKLYRSVDLSDDDVATLWTICRVFLRGLHIQERFGSGPGQTSKIMKRFAQIIGPHMTMRAPE